MVFLWKILFNGFSLWKCLLEYLLEFIYYLPFNINCRKFTGRRFNQITFIFRFLRFLFILSLLFTPWEFFTSVNADGLSLEFEWQQVSRTLLSVLADLNNAAVWMVSTRPRISKSSNPFINHSVTVPRVPITNSINVTVHCSHLPFNNYNFYYCCFY